MALQPDGTRVALARGAAVEQGATIETANASSVVLAFSNGSTLSLGADTALSITKYLQEPLKRQLAVVAEEVEDVESSSETELDLRRGELVGNVKKLNQARGSAFTVRTPVGAAGIRGTIFRVIYRPDGNGKAFFSVTTLEGSVEVFSGIMAVPVAVGANDEVQVTVDIDPVTGQLLSAPMVLGAVRASPATINAIANAVVAAVEAIASIVFGPANAPTPPGFQLLSNETGSPEPAKPPVNTTPGEGRGG